MIQLTQKHVKDRFEQRMSEFKPEDRAKFRQDLYVFDFEVFPDDVLLSVYDVGGDKTELLWTPRVIQNWLDDNFLNNPSVVMVGFNSKSYDNRIMDALLDGASERHLKVLNDALIGEEDVGPWRSGNRNFKPRWTQRTFDIGFDIGQRKKGKPPNEKRIPEISLKKWQRLNGYVVERSPIGFNTKNLTKAQRDSVGYYGSYDVWATAMLLMSDSAWNPCFNARRVLVDDYSHMGVNWEMTKPAITAAVLRANRGNYDVPLDWRDRKFKLPSNVRIWKHRHILNKYLNHTIGELQDMSGKDGEGVFVGDVFGIPHRYGVGGVHGCGDGKWYCHGDGIYGLDVASMYPNMMRHYDLLSRQVVGENRETFGEFIDLRTHVYKPAGDTRAEGLKLVLNGGFGSMGFEKSDMYDPENLANVTILGQLLITDLMEKLSHHIELIQSNTDGIFFRVKNHSQEVMADCREIVKAYEKRTKLEMEWTEFERIYQRDISNYVAKTKSGKTITKGGWFSTKHCTMEPYLIENRLYSAMHEGKQMPTDGLDIMRFAVEVKRDKNSECFVINGVKDDREWLDVVPVAPFSDKAQEIYVLTKEGSRRKATNCPDNAALVENVEVADIDMSVFHADFEVDVAVGDAAQGFAKSDGGGGKHMVQLGILL